MEARKFIVTGRVQGVGFRWFVSRHAHTLGINGWVKNNRDGSVEIWAEALTAKLVQFESLLRKGPPGSAVRNVQTVNAGAVHDYKGFDIVF